MDRCTVRFLFITLFPEQIEQAAGHSIIKRAVDAGLVEVSCINPRDFATDRHRTVDDTPFGGGAGMVLKPEPMVAVLLYYLRKTLFFYEQVKGFVLNIWEGIMSLRGVRNIPLFIFYTLAIWACYFFHFYFTFYCFAFTAHLGVMAALVMFVGGTFAVIVPTPNGAGPWHFAIISMMMLYGVNVTDAGIFALIVHGIQTFLVVLLGVYGLAALPFTNRQRK